MTLLSGKKSRIAAIPLMLAAISLGSSAVHAEDPDEFSRRLSEEYASFSGQVNAQFDSFRNKIDREYAEFMARPWKSVPTVEPLKRPDHPDPGPTVVREDENPLDTPPNQLPLTEIAPTLKPQPRPQPLAPVNPTPGSDNSRRVNFTFYGTPVDILAPDFDDFRLKGAKEKHYAEGWRKLCQGKHDGIVNECLNQRERLALPDWHYFLLADKVASALTSKGSNEQIMLLGYILNRSGYDVRFAADHSAGRLHLLFNSAGIVYGRLRYKMDGGWYYPFTEPTGPIAVCDFTTPGESPMRLMIERTPALSFSPGEKRRINVHGHKELTLTVTTNRNLINLLADFPDASAGSTPLTRWTAYAMTPASDQIRRDIYPALRQALKGKNQYQAVDLLLKVAQSFPYEYDEKIWGKDRVFFMDESWHYPYSDCEDHAINLTRMIRDLLGLETCLVSYPGHLAAAVAITDGSAKGDYITHGGTRYTVCDATYFYAPAGSTAPAYRSAAATLIPLN